MNRALVAYVLGNAAHEAGHMVVLFKTSRLAALNFLPHEEAQDGSKGVFEATTVTDLSKDDCVALAASMVGELVCLGEYDPQHLLDDRKQVKRLAGRPLEDFVLEAYEIIKENILFFTMLNMEVRKKMLEVIRDSYSLDPADQAKLPKVISVLTIAEVEELYKRADATLAVFPKSATD